MRKPRKGAIRRFNWANPVILGLTLAQLGSGSVGLTKGEEQSQWVLWLHGIGAYAVVLVLLWKGRIIFESLARRRHLSPARWNDVLLVVLLLAALSTGILWTFGGRRLIGNYSLITVHVGIAIGILLFLPWHVVRKLWVFRDKNATGRRTFLRFGGMALGGLGLWLAAGRAMDLLDLPGSRRRFTGSYETGSFTGEFPVVTWLFDYPAPVDAESWRLTIDGAVEQPLVLTYEQLEQMTDTSSEAIIDCTGGWYSHQGWQGVRVGRLLELSGMRASARSVSFEAVSGYGRRFAVDSARGYILALSVARERLDHGHGFPVRLVAPGHRGFAWVKWISRITVNETSEILQPPVPLQ